MKNKIKNIICMIMIVILGYTQIGCQSSESQYEKNEQSVNSKQDSNYNDNSIEDNDNSIEDNDNSIEDNDNVSIIESSDSKIHFINTGNSDAILKN